MGHNNMENHNQGQGQNRHWNITHNTRQHPSNMADNVPYSYHNPQLQPRGQNFDQNYSFDVSSGMGYPNFNDIYIPSGLGTSSETNNLNNNNKRVYEDEQYSRSACKRQNNNKEGVYYSEPTFTNIG